MSKKQLWSKGENLDEVLHRFTVGNDPILDQRLVYWDAKASSAHAKMLQEIGILSEEDLCTLLPALELVALEGRAGTFAIADEEEDCHTAIENYLVSAIGDAGRRIHTGRSRNDQVLVAMRLFLRDAYLILTERLLNFERVLFEQGKGIGHKVFPGHTHFQPAMPQSFQMWMGAFAEEAAFLAEVGFQNLSLVNRNPLGAGSGFSTPLGIDRERTAELLKFDSVQPNPINVQNSRGKEELRFCNYCVEIGMLLEKLSWDLIVYSSFEHGYLSLPLAYTTGSSIMPQKRNPDVLELMRARVGKIRSARQELENMIAKLPSHYHRDFQYTKEPVFKAFDHLIEMIPVLGQVVRGLTFNEDRAREALTADLFATYDAYRLVREGKTFRDAYQESVKRLARGEIMVDELLKEFDIIAEQTDREYEALEGRAEVLREKQAGFALRLELE